MMVVHKLFVLLTYLCLLHSHACGKNSIEEELGVRYATKCEVCKIVTKEIGEKLTSTDSSDVIETGYHIDGEKKKTKYSKSELRLVETLEGVCLGLLDYRIHKERTDSTRWAKMMSQTFKTLHGLKEKGVKVELGIPYELWDEPSAEVAQLKTQCELFIEDNEEDITEWYFGDHPTTLQDNLCPIVVEPIDRKCLKEPYGEDVKKEENNGEVKKRTNKKKKKGETDSRSKSEL